MKFQEQSSKTCTECDLIKNVSEFHRNKDSPDGFHSKCKACKNGKAREYYNSGVENTRTAGHNAREYHLKKTYGITTEQYEALLKTQNSSCAICEKPSSEEKRSFAVDHDHKTGEIRGLLCHYCNYRMVGKHRDGSLLRKIADYVEQGTGWFVPKNVKVRKRKTVKRLYDEKK